VCFLHSLPCRHSLLCSFVPSDGKDIFAVHMAHGNDVPHGSAFFPVVSCTVVRHVKKHGRTFDLQKHNYYTPTKALSLLSFLLNIYCICKRNSN
jgi:hypothetical protein